MPCYAMHHVHVGMPTHAHAPYLYLLSLFCDSSNSRPWLHNLLVSPRETLLSMEAVDIPLEPPLVDLVLLEPYLRPACREAEQGPALVVEDA